MNVYRNEKELAEYLSSQIEALFYTVIPANDAPLVKQVTVKKLQQTFSIRLTDLNPQQVTLLLDELNIFGTVIEHQIKQTTLTVLLQTAESEHNITAVLCFLLDEKQIHFSLENQAVELVKQHNCSIDIDKQLAAIDKAAVKTSAAQESNRSLLTSEASTIRVAVEKSINLLI